jgi:WD40 repeat protein
VAEPDENPYVGPRPFERTDRPLFFGRERELRELLSLVVAHRIVLLYATSGAGKTSLLNAGLLPLLEEEEGFEVVPPARVAGVELPSVVENPFVHNVIESWRGALGEGGGSSSLAGFLGGHAHPVDDDGFAAPRLVVFDQFEELFTYHQQHWRQREPFLVQLAELLDHDPLLRVVVAIREDYLAQLDRYRALVAGGFRTRLRLERLGADATLTAVTAPVVGRHRCYAPGAAEQLVADLLEMRVDVGGEVLSVEGEYADPVQLQVVCQSLWASLPPEVEEITADDLERFGDVDDVLSRFYDTAVAASAAAAGMSERDLRRNLERSFITPIGTRGTIYAGANETGNIPNAAVEELERRHLLRGEYRAGTRWLELAHDRLIVPIRSSNTAWLGQRLQPMQRQAELWSDENKPQRLLLRGRDLKEAQRWARENAASVSTVEAEFLERSHEQERAERRRRIMFGALIAGVLIVAAAIGFLALKARAEQHKAQHAAKVAQSQALAAGVPALLRGRLDDAMRQSLEALDRSDTTIDARKAVLAAVQRTDGLVRFLRFSQAANSLAVARDGTIAVALDGGKVALLGPTGRDVRQTPISEKHSNVDALAFDPVRPRLAAAFADYVELFTTEPNHTLKPLGGRVDTNQDRTSGISFSDDGRWLASAGTGGLTLWRVDADGHLRAVPIRGAPKHVTALAFTGSGPLLVVSTPYGLLSWDLRRPGATPVRRKIGRAGALAVGAGGGAVANRGRAYLWHGSPSGRLVPVERVGGRPTALAFAGDGGLLALGDASGSVALWGLAEHERVGAPLLGQGGRIVSIAFEPGGSVVAVASADHTVAIWDTNSRVRALRISDAFGSDILRAVFARSAILAAVTTTGKVKVGDLEGSPSAVAARASPVYALAASPDGSRLVALESSGAMAALNGRMKPTRVLLPSAAGYPSVADDGSGVGPGLGGSVQLWHAAGKSVEQLLPPRAWLSPKPVAISADGHTVAAYYSGPGKVVIWRLAGDGSAKATILGSPGTGVNDLVFSPDGTVLATANGNGEIERWPIGKPGAHTELPAGPGGPATLAFTPDGRVLASVGADGKVRLWAVQNTLAELGSLPLTGVTSVVFSPNRHWLAAVQDGKIRVYDVTLWAQTGAALDRVRRRFRAALWCDQKAHCG